MGHDVQAMTNHQLNTSSMAVLAEDLANRLQVNVQYGYRDDLYIEGVSNQTFDLVIIGSINTHQKYTFTLVDSHYLDKIKYPSKYANEILFELYEDETTRKNYLDIFKFVCQLHNSYDCRWWAFCNNFTDDINSYCWSALQFYRKYTKWVAEAIGGSAAIYFDDQGPAAKIFEMEDYATFEEINKILHQDFKADYLNVSQFMQQYNQLGKYAVEKTPLAFFDDFKDLENPVEL